MHIKSNIEHNIVDVVILSLCPLIFVLTNAKSALIYVCLTAVCLLISAFICSILNKVFSKTLKIFATTMISTLIITIFNFFVSEYQVLDLTASNSNYYAVLSTIIMSIDIFCIDSKADVNNYLTRVFSTVFVYALISIFYTIIKEFLSVGTMFNWKPFKYSGYEFFNTLTFNFILMGFTCVLFEVIFRSINKYLENREMAYAKLLKQIKNERLFQYDNLRRQKLLESNVQYNYIGTDDMEHILDKNNKNESLTDILPEETSENENHKTVIKRKKSKLRVSKETKIQQMFDNGRKGGNV